ncbi:hypothetical protein [Thalassomonas viridans]|uniref:hypothetical protein n=1 Tax=Thalassomonas viridans TaxID=137584 RepID=UPI001F26547C|nr:hypothetical protein [Thalassomonas viridans]
MSDETWEHYQERVLHNRGRHVARRLARLRPGRYLYHATSPSAIGNIAVNGLCPRDPNWRPYNKKDRIPRYDASKDGFLSMAVTRAGAGAMGKVVLLRMLIRPDIGYWQFRQVGDTEVRTTFPIPVSRLEKSTDLGLTWRPLTRPAKPVILLRGG